ncbi:hypothetical protein LG943_03720 [Streptomonospora sp. S1-112]|uniref:Uncharacterized protein n=1 Tax=Streptomonospora mangrovi TaxID=2883123 RepID=A0A9X3SLL1_9ACTN|nr:hypothetical protein [Streptomonospora mangrovi]MDA0563441.1 hypothetical protein [Streptomonospora mangrovi]
MSPKKRKRRPAGRAPARAGAPAAATQDRDPDSAAPAAPPAEDGAAAPRRRVSRTPVVLDDRRRWPVAVWIVLAAVWLLGSPLFLVFFLAEGFALVGEPAAGAGMRATAWYLLGLLVCALGVPLAGAAAAVLMRRRIAALLFGAALVVSAVPLFLLASPAELFDAVRTGLTAEPPSGGR